MRHLVANFCIKLIFLCFLYLVITRLKTLSAFKTTRKLTTYLKSYFKNPLKPKDPIEPYQTQENLLESKRTLVWTTLKYLKGTQEILGTLKIVGNVKKPMQPWNLVSKKAILGLSFIKSLAFNISSLLFLSWPCIKSLWGWALKA